MEKQKMFTGYSYPQTDVQKIYNLEHFDELEESTKAVTSGVMVAYYGVSVTDQNSINLLVKHLKGIATEDEKKELSSMVQYLEVGVDEHAIYLEFRNQVLKINKTVLDRINQIVDIREKDNETKNEKEHALNLIENAKINMPMYSYEVDRILANLLGWKEANVYAKAGTASTIASMFGCRIINLEDGEIRSALYNRLKNAI